MDRLEFVRNAQLASGQLRDAIRLLPGLAADPDPYDAALLRAAVEDGSLATLLVLLADVAESLRWANLAALHATQTPAALRAAGWSRDERRAITPLRQRLTAAVTHTYSSALILDDAGRCARRVK